MTSEELYTAIAEIIIPQEKLKSTSNSHRRKQWENKKYWHLCTKWKSCKFGKVKHCELVGSEKNTGRYNRLCEDCFCFLNEPRFSMRIAGIFFDCDSSRFKKYSYHSKILRNCSNRAVRRYKKEIGNFSYYRKIFDYEWSCW